MRIEGPCVVTLNYHVTDLDDNVVDEGQTPLVYLHGGFEGIFAPIEEALTGCKEGDRVDVALTAEQAFGEYDDDLVEVADLSQLPSGVGVGDQVEGESEDDGGVVLFTIVQIDGDRAVLDGNHPLAGLDITFHAQVASVRAASAQEIAEGGPLA